MEFGNLKDTYYIIIPILILLIFILGVTKRNKILELIGWNKDTNIQLLKGIFLIIGTLLVFIALLSPQKLKEKSKVEVKGNDLYILMDISKSMLAQDVYPNRLEASKRELKKILTKLKGDRIGIIPFSDSAYIQMPLTDDYFMGNNYIDAIDSNLISGGGTQLLKGLELANKSFEKTKTKNKNIIIFTDGGDDKNNRDIENYIKENKLKVFIFGVGSKDGSVLPGKDGFIKDSSGKIVVSKINENLLKEMSDKSQGRYYSLNNTSENSLDFIGDLNRLEKEHTRNNEIKIYKKYYQLPLALGVLFIIIGYFIRKKRVIIND